MSVNHDCPDFKYCKNLCGAGSNPYCETDNTTCRIHIERHKENFPELYKIIHHG